MAAESDATARFGALMENAPIASTRYPVGEVDRLALFVTSGDAAVKRLAREIDPLAWRSHDHALMLAVEYGNEDKEQDAASMAADAASIVSESLASARAIIALLSAVALGEDAEAAKGGAE